MAYDFDWNATTGVLTITTDLMVLRFQSGAIVGIQDVDSSVWITGGAAEVITELSGGHQVVTNDHYRGNQYFIGCSSADGTGSWHIMLGDPAVATFNESANVATVDYSPAYLYDALYNYAHTTGSFLNYTFTVDDATGEVTILLEGKEVDTNFLMQRAYLPVISLDQSVAGNSLISGIKEWKYNDPDCYYGSDPFDRDAYVGFYQDGFMSCGVFNSASNNLAAAIWNETTELTSNYGFVYHFQNDYADFSSSSGFEAVTQVTELALSDDPGPWRSTITGGPWRITVQSNWLEVARRWRVRYKAVQGDAKYLWENANSWVRRIHATYTRSGLYGDNTWAGVAGVADDSSKVLYYAQATGSGQQIVYGDNDWHKYGSIPNTAMRTAWSGVVDFKVMGYYGCYALFYQKPNLQLALSPSSIPGGYPVFPDLTNGPPRYGVGTANTGTSQNWMNNTDFMSAISSISVTYGGVDVFTTSSVTELTIGTGSRTLTVGTGLSYVNGTNVFIVNTDANKMIGTCTSYNSSTGELVVNVTQVSGSGTFSQWNIGSPDQFEYCWSVHQGSTFLANYIEFNYPQFCQGLDRNGDPNNVGFYCDGAYWDILGTDEDNNFTNKGGTRVQNSKSSQMGGRDLVKGQYATYPVMCEDAHFGFIPYAFYWFAGGTRKLDDTEQFLPSGFAVNHPFRAVCLGSFMWSCMGNPTTGRDYRRVVMLNCLPEYMMEGDYEYDAAAPVSRAVAKLYCNRELHHDLPTTWKTEPRGSYPQTLAYYRSNTGNMVRFEDRGSNVLAFVEERNADYDRLVFNDSTYDISTDNIDVDFFRYTRGSYASLPSDDADLTTFYSNTDMTNVATDDEVRVSESGNGYVLHEFKDVADPYATKMEILCELQVALAPSAYTVYLQIYDRVTLGGMWVTVDSDTTSGANVDFSLSFTLDSGSTPTFANCKDTETREIASRVWQSNIPPA